MRTEQQRPQQSPPTPASEAQASHRGPSVRLLEREPELGLRVPAESIAHAQATLVAPVRWFARGVWEAPTEYGAGHLGFLLLEGLLARDVIIAGTKCTELLGPGDIVQPAAAIREDGLVRYHVLWEVLEPVKVAVLDDEFSRLLAEWPQVMRVLLERAVRRSLRLSVHAALLQLSPVETRLLILFWFLAERWGRVTPAGVVLRLRLSHQMLGQLVGCRRASVTTALHRMEESGFVSRRADRTWLLRGSPPNEMAQIHWHERGTDGESPGLQASAGAR
jgi:CRP/FNR family transcriptional regulator, cyclic AMP receptor protein